MDQLIDDLRDAYVNESGYDLARTLSPVAPASNSNRLYSIYRSTNFSQAQAEILNRISYDSVLSQKLSTEEANGWAEVYFAYWKAVGEILKAEEAAKNNTKVSWLKVYEAWKEMANALIRSYQNSGLESFTVPCLYVAGKYIRIFAIKADESASNSANSMSSYQDETNPDAEKNEKLEDAARLLNRIFNICLSDRASLMESRKWALYYIINLLFKTYFKLNSISLSKNIINAIEAYRGDLPDLHRFPKSHQVTYKYYRGVICFLEELYVEAEKHLTEAWKLCHKDATKNKELILTYLIPCHLLTTHTLPTPVLLAPYPRLQALFGPLSRCIKSGDLAGFDAALVAGEEEFTKRRIYLTLERGREISLRNLLRKVYVASAFQETNPGVKRTRISIAEFGAAISIGSKESMDSDEVECLIANMIYKSLMKGYIAREAGMVVLSKTGAFPGTGV